MEETFNWADCEPDGFREYETIVFRFSSLGHGLDKCRPQRHSQATHCDLHQCPAPARHTKADAQSRKPTKRNTDKNP